jgi:hypothetical protein
MNIKALFVNLSMIAFFCNSIGMEPASVSKRMGDAVTSFLLLVEGLFHPIEPDAKYLEREKKYENPPICAYDMNMKNDIVKLFPGDEKLKKSREAYLLLNDYSLLKGIKGIANDNIYLPAILYDKSLIEGSLSYANVNGFNPTYNPYIALLIPGKNTMVNEFDICFCQVSFNGSLSKTSDLVEEDLNKDHFCTEEIYYLNKEKRKVLLDLETLKFIFNMPLTEREKILFVIDRPNEL